MTTAHDLPIDQRLETVLAAAQHAQRLPSVVAGIHGAGVDWRGGGGAADRWEDPGRVQFRIGSITKTFTAVLVMQLIDEGVIDLATPVGAFVPGLGEYSSATIGALLSHRSGMQAEPVGQWWERVEGVDITALVAANDGGDAVARPDQMFHYSNLAFGYLGAAIEAICGAGWSTVLEERLLGPLQLSRTSYHAELPAAQGYAVDPWRLDLSPEPHPDYRAMAPAGQLWSTIDDLLSWGRFLLHGDEAIVPTALLEQMRVSLTDPVAAGAAGREGYGLGLQVVGDRFGHNGGVPGFGATLLIDPVQDAVSATLTNGNYRGYGIAGQLLDHLGRSPSALPARPAQPWLPSAPVPSALIGLLGPWVWTDQVMIARWESDAVVFRNPSGVEVHRFGLVEAVIRGLAGYLTGETLRVLPDGSLDCATFRFVRPSVD